jgi:hypothetical protein
MDPQIGNMNHSLDIFAYTGEEIVRLSDSTKYVIRLN